MNLQDELLAQDYSIGIYDPEFDGDVYSHLNFSKEIDSENFLINLEVGVSFKFGSHEGCEEEDLTLENLTVIDEDSVEQVISDDLYNLIKESITTYYE